MVVQGIRKAAIGQVCSQNLNCYSTPSNATVEWCRSLHPAMQTSRLSLLRLGRQLQGHEVRLQLVVFLIYSNKINSSFLRNSLTKFAAANPQVEITVSPRPRRHPVIKGTYINGREKAICVRNLTKEQVLQKAELLRDANGEKLKKVTKPVKSINESVRGVWSPYHGGGMHV